MSVSGVVHLDVTGGEAIWLERSARARLDAILHTTPVGARVRLTVGTKLPPRVDGMPCFDDDLWAELADRYQVQVEGDTGEATRRWVEYLSRLETDAA